MDTRRYFTHPVRQLAPIGAALVILLASCSSDADDIRVEAPSEDATTAEVTATTEFPTTTATPTTTTEQVDVDDGPPIVIVSSIVGDEENFVVASGTFEVTSGADVLGCSTGTIDEDAGRDGIDLRFTCETGTRTGSFTVRIIPQGGPANFRSDWELVASTGDWNDATGTGDWSGTLSADQVTGREVLGGDMSFGVVAAPLHTVPRLSQRRDSSCGEGYGSFDGLAEFASVDDTLVRLDVMSGEITEHGPSPATCAYWLGDADSGRRIATSDDGKTFWFGPSDGEWETEVEFDTKVNLLSRSIEANRVLLRDWNEILVVDATTGQQIGEPIAGSFADGRSFSSYAVSPDESLIVVGDGGREGGRVIVVDASTAQELFSVATVAPVTTLHFDASTGDLIAGLFTGEVLTIDLDGRAVVSEVALTSQAAIQAIGARSDGLIVVSTSDFAELVDRRSGPTGASIIFRNAVSSTVQPDGRIATLSSAQEWNIHEITG